MTMDILCNPQDYLCHASAFRVWLMTEHLVPILMIVASSTFCIIAAKR